MTTPRETELDGQPSAETDAAASSAGTSPSPAAPSPAAAEETSPAAPAAPAEPQSTTSPPVEARETPAAPEPEAVPRAGGARPAGPAGAPAEPGPGWAQGAAPGGRSGHEEPTTVLPGGRRVAPQRAVPPTPPPTPRPTARPASSAGGARPLVGRTRRARLSLRRIDPWSVFLFSLVASVFLGIALVVAVAVLYAVLGSLGVTASINQLFAEVTGGSPTTGALLTSGRIIGGAAVLAAVNVVFLTLLSTLGALLYNLCASFTGGIELTLGERD